jgi:hypothetical protein
MSEELARLRDEAPLFALLTHYATLATPDRQAWHVRHTQPDIDAKQVARLHGELMAHGYLKQNTGVVPGCYRATRDGLRALKQLREAE